LTKLLAKSSNTLLVKILNPLFRDKFIKNYKYINERYLVKSVGRDEGGRRQ